MEYTKSIGDVYESFTGTPEEIARLMELMQEKDIVTTNTVHVKEISQKEMDEIVKQCMEEGENMTKRVM